MSLSQSIDSFVGDVCANTTVNKLEGGKLRVTVYLHNDSAANVTAANLHSVFGHVNSAMTLASQAHYAAFRGWVLFCNDTVVIP